MYGFLASRLPRPAANLVAGLWYALLLVLALYGALEPAIDFRYENL